jgi:hypothetical protein
LKDLSGNFGIPAGSYEMTVKSKDKTKDKTEKKVDEKAQKEEQP